MRPHGKRNRSWQIPGHGRTSSSWRDRGGLGVMGGCNGNMTPSRYLTMLCMGALAVITIGCSTVAATYPPPANPFLADAQPLDGKALPPTKVVLVWLQPTGTSAPPETAQRALADKIKNRFSAGKPLTIVGLVTLPAPLIDPLAQVRRATAPYGTNQALVLMPTTSEASSPVWLQYGRDGSGSGTRIDSYISIAAVAIDLSTGSKLFSVISSGEARLLKMDYEDARPFYPRISPGHSSAFIYPEGPAFPPGEVRAVALEQAVNGLIYKLDRAIGS
jgi:hypothetical protein